MGQQGSKKKSKSGKGLLGDLADAAEGATSSITKAIEDTSHQVTSSIENTTKSVTEAIDKTAKNVSGTVDSTVSDVNKKADEAGTAVDDAAANLKAQADQARKDGEGKAKGFKDAADSKARELEEAAKALEDAANAKAKEMEQSASAKKKELEDAAMGLEAAAEAKAKEFQSSALAKKKEMEDAANAKKKELEDAANAKAKEVEAKAKEMKEAAEAKAKEAEAAAAAKKKELEAKAAELEKAAAARKKQLEEAATAKIKEAELKAKEAQKAAEGAAAAAEVKAKEMEKAAADKAKELEDAVAEAAKEAEAKKKEMESAAAGKAKELESAVQGQANAARESIQGKVSNAQSQATGARGALDSTVGNLRGSAEETMSNVKSQGQAVVDDAVQSAQKIQDDINRTISDANQALTDAQKQAQTAKSGLTDLAGNTAGLLKGTAGTLTDSVKSTAAAAMDQAVTFAAETAKKSVQEVSGTVGKATEDVTRGVSGAIQNVSHSAVGAAGGFAAGLLGKAGDLTGALAQGAANISNMTKSASGQADERKADLDDIADSLIQDTTTTTNKTADSLIKDTTTATKKATDSMDDMADNFMKGAASVPKKIKDEIKEIVKEFDPTNAVTVCKENEMKDGEMKVFQVGEGSVLLCKENGVFSAIGTKCSHYGAPLVKGVLSNGKVRCPWHGACFNTSTGDIEDSPGLDSLSCYQVKVENGDVLVSASADQLKHNTRTKELAKRKLSDSRTFVIIGGGGAGASCAETLRQEGFSGRIVVLSKESDLPYDRPKLSKALSSTGKDLALRSPDFYKNGDIEIMLGHEVSAVDVAGKTVTCKDGTKISFTSLMIATGGRPVTLNVPGNDLENVCYLRTPGDANKIAEAAKDKNAVVVGTSFIGMEVAAYLHGKAKTVTVIGRSPTPFANVFGPQVGERLKKLFLEKDVKFHFETEVEEFVGEGGKLKAVKLKNGETVDAELCVVGIGVKPSTEFLTSSDILMNENGYIPVDETLKTSSDGVFAGGDIVEFPLSTYDDEFVSIGHWQIAQTHGRVAGRSMLGKAKPLHTVPFFWASMFGKSLRYAGCGLGVDDYVIDGSLEDMKFVSYACAGHKVVAVAAMGMDPVASQYASYVSKGKVLKKSDIKSNPQGWLAEMTC